MQLETGEIYHGFKLLEEKRINEINSLSRLFVHEKSGARLYQIENDDDNKVFSISFKTPPNDSTGLPHILEHSVLCGSRKFPTKEPFVELVKGSLNTFLNAMTFPDKTMYPVASRNDKDFFNLMDVYLDAVLYPNIYDNPYTLMQEGWHYELENREEPLRYKGVVYNEMKGAFSSPEQVLFRKILESLFPDTPYGLESGGDPEVIPQLTQNDFLNFHKKYYHPSNSYIYLYGNGDILEQLNFIDGEYLKNFDKLNESFNIEEQPAFDNLQEVSCNYPISPEDDDKDKTYMSLNFVIDKSINPEISLAFDILEYLLLENAASPLKKALLEAELGKDVFGSYEQSILQPVFSIVLKDSNLEQKEEFIKIVTDTLEKLVNEGISKKLVEGAINHKEFKLREADYGNYPKGLIYGIRIMDSWLYDHDPGMHLTYDKYLENIKKALNEPYFEDLISKYILKNPHSTLLLLTPQKGMAEEREQKIKQQLADYKDSLSTEEIDNIIKNTEELKARQIQPDSPEALASIPMISIDDINPKPEMLPLEEDNHSSISIWNHPMFTNKIAYLSMLFDTSAVSQDMLPYAALLAQVLGETNTEKYSYEDLANEINISTGGMDFKIQAFNIMGDDMNYVPKFIVKSRALVDKMPDLINLLGEICGKSLFDDKRRLREIVQETRSRLEMAILGNGHVMAMNRLYSYFSPAGAFMENTQGISFYKFIVDLERNFDSRFDEIVSNLCNVSKQIFSKNNLLVSIAADEKDCEYFKTLLPDFIENIGSDTLQKASYSFEARRGNEGLLTPGDVQYVAKGYNFSSLGYQYTGALQVLRSIIRMDYLWNRIRVQGGAYGAFAQFGRTGAMILCSYRDPNLTETLDVYDEAYKYIEAFDADEREMTKYIIGTISQLDTPLTPSMKGDRAVEYALGKITYEDLLRERETILKTSKKDIRNLASMMRNVINENYFCVLGSEGKIKENKDIFNRLTRVFG